MRGIGRDIERDRKREDERQADLRRIMWPGIVAAALFYALATPLIALANPATLVGGGFLLSVGVWFFCATYQRNRQGDRQVLILSLLIGLIGLIMLTWALVQAHTISERHSATCSMLQTRMLASRGEDAAATAFEALRCWPQ